MIDTNASQQLTSDEERIIDSMVEWYVHDALVLWKEAEKNAAFFEATKVAMSRSPATIRRKCARISSASARR